MRKTIHQFRVYVTDDNRVGDFTKWKQYSGARATKAQAWELLKHAINTGFYRYAKVVETRVYKGKD